MLPSMADLAELRLELQAEIAARQPATTTAPEPSPEAPATDDWLMPPKRSSSPSQGNGDGLEAAWARVSAPELKRILDRATGTEWEIEGERLKGTCPASCEKGKDERSAWAFPGKGAALPPTVACDHLNSCGFRENAFELLCRAFPSRGEAAAFVLEVAGLTRRTVNGPKPKVGPLDGYAQDVLRWAGWVAEKDGVSDKVLAMATQPEALTSIQEGVSARARGDRVKSPGRGSRAEHAIRRLIRKAQTAPTDEEKRASLPSIWKIVKHIAGTGQGRAAEETVWTVGLDGDRCEVAAVSNDEILSYSKLASKAVRFDVVFPVAAKDSANAWRDVVRDAMRETQTVEVMVDHESVGDFVDSLVARFLSEDVLRHDGTTPTAVAHLTSGGVLEIDAGFRLIQGKSLTAKVASATSGGLDRVCRADIVASARRFGLSESRVGDLRVWRFPPVTGSAGSPSSPGDDLFD